MKSFHNMVPYGLFDSGHHGIRQWLVACQYQAITWTNPGLSSMITPRTHLNGIHNECNYDIDGLVQERCNSSALAMECRLSCIKPSIWYICTWKLLKKLIRTQWGHMAWSRLVQLMACCLTAPSHYLNPWWLIIKGVLWYSPESNFEISTCKLNPYHVLGNYIFKITTMSPRHQHVNQPTLTNCGLVTPYGDKICINIDSGNGLVPDVIKPLPAPMLTYH